MSLSESLCCLLLLIKELSQQGGVDAAEHLLDASIGVPVAYLKPLCKGIGIEVVLPVQRVPATPVLHRFR